MKFFALEKIGAEPTGPYATQNEAQGYLIKLMEKQHKSLLIQDAMLSHTRIRQVDENGTSTDIDWFKA